MKTIKQLVLLTVAFGALTVSSCKKDKAPTAAVSITATVDGTATNFNVNAAALRGTVNGLTITNIQGTTSGGATLSLALTGTVIAGKTYSDAATDDNDKPLVVYSPSATSDDDYFNDDDNTANLPSVTITSVTSTTIDGTFKGLIENSKGTKSIADGKFHVNIQTHP